MKKLILLIACAVFATGASAQIQFGVKAGLNLASLTNSEILTEGVISGKMKPSFYVGALAEYTISDFVGIQPELVYSRQGNFYSETVEGVTGKMWVRLDYLNVPIMVKLYLMDNLSLDLGPQFGFLLSAKRKISVSGSDDPEENGTIDMKDYLNGFDMSVGMGVSYRILGKIDVSVRYNLGLTDILADKLKDELMESSTNDKMKNGVIQIGAGYRF